MKRIAVALAIVVLALAVAGASWWFRPWSDYSPSEVYAFSRAEDRTVPYRMMETIYPHRTIAPSPLHEQLPVAATGLDPMGVTPEDGRTIGFDAFAGERTTTGLIVLSDGEIVLERYFNGETADDRHTSWSVAKSVVATLIGTALMEGRIASVDDRAETYAAEYLGVPYGETSIRDLLAMASGIDFDEDYEVEGSDIRRLFFGTFFWNRDVDDIVREHGRERPAGETFDYISANTAVLAAVLRGAYDRPLADIAGEKLLDPIGSQGGTWLTDRQGGGGKELGYCCLQLNLRDFARLGQLYVDAGMANGVRVIPEEWVEFVATPPTPDHEPGTDGRFGYGHHFWLPPDADGELMMRGYDGQVVWMDLERDVVVAMTSADRDYSARLGGFLAMARAIARDAAAAPDRSVAIR